MKKTNILAFNLFSLIKVPITIYDNSKILMKYSNLNVPSKLVKIIDENRLLICKERITCGDEEIIRLTDPSYFTYFGIRINNYEFIVGPFLEYEYDSIRLNSLKMRLKVVGEDNHIFDDFYHNLVILLPKNIEFIINTFIKSCTQELPPLRYKNIVGKKIILKNKEQTELMFKSLAYVKQNYEAEALFLKVIQSGDLNQANSFMTKNIMTHLPERALNDTLRNEKTRLTILNTLCNRAAIRGGIDYQLGHQISTNYGIRIERLKSIYATDKLTKEIIIGYTQAVNDYSLKGYSKLIRKAILNIRRNITSKYSLKELSDDLFVSKEHLARTFKKETKMTVSEYVNHAKIHEATKILKRKEQSIINISTMLGYSSSSQFSNIFKKQMGVSPKDYKNEVSE